MTGVEDTFERQLSRLIQYMQPRVAERLAARRVELLTMDRSACWSALLDEICDNGDLLLSRRIRFASRNHLHTLLTEVLIQQEYYFELTETRPLIIDAGANFGLATYYFKRIFASCRIIAIEPNPVLATIYRLNAERNGFEDIELIEAALTKRARSTIFWASTVEDPASSIYYSQAPTDAQPITVRGVSLRELITEPIALLKLDVEGAEFDALEEAADRLHLVARLVCECHVRPGVNRLGRILTLLDEAGFHTAVARADWDEQKPRFRLGKTVLNRRSYLIYAVRQPEADRSQNSRESTRGA